MTNYSSRPSNLGSAVWPAPGLDDTELSEPAPSLVCRAICELTISRRHRLKVVPERLIAGHCLS
jgi:hypothetical protein